MAAEAGSLKLFGLKSKQTYIVDLYLPDAVGGLWAMNGNGAAASTSPTQFRVPEACVITDLSVATGTTAVGAVLNVNNSSQVAVFRYANFLNTLSHRPDLNIVIPEGAFIGATQI